MPMLLAKAMLMPSSFSTLYAKYGIRCTEESIRRDHRFDCDRFHPCEAEAGQGAITLEQAEIVFRLHRQPQIRTRAEMDAQAQGCFRGEAAGDACPHLAAGQ